MYTRTQVNTLINELSSIRKKTVGKEVRKIDTYIDVLTLALIRPVDFFQLEIQEAKNYVEQHKTISGIS